MYKNIKYEESQTGQEKNTKIISLPIEIIRYIYEFINVKNYLNNSLHLTCHFFHNLNGKLPSQIFGHKLVDLPQKLGLVFKKSKEGKKSICEKKIRLMGDSYILFSDFLPFCALQHFDIDQINFILNEQQFKNPIIELECLRFIVVYTILSQLSAVIVHWRAIWCC